MYFRDRFFLNFDWEMMTYWALVAFVTRSTIHRESQERELTAAQLQTQLAEAQLEALQRQLHPHFLFNTLNTISALMHRDVHAADEMLVQLSDLLRLTLDRIGTQQVPLKDEIDFLRKYLEIEQTRFGDRLQVNIDVDARGARRAVPNLILQPLVENALRHGIGPRIGGGRVDVDGRARSTERLHADRARQRRRPVARQAECVSLGGRAVQHPLPPREPLRRPPSVRVPDAAGGGLVVTIVIPFERVDPEASPESQWRAWHEPDPNPGRRR